MQRRGGRLLVAGLVRRREHHLLCLGHATEHHLYIPFRYCGVSGKVLMIRDSLDYCIFYLQFTLQRQSNNSIVDLACLLHLHVPAADATPLIVISLRV